MRLPRPLSPTTCLLLALGVSGVAGCSRPARYEVNGQVVAVTPSRQEITLKHEDIRGFMPAMTMPFKVRDQRDLEPRVVGELVRATLLVGGNEAVLIDIERTGEAPLTGSPPAPPAFDLLEPGETAPDEPFVDQSGASRRLSEWRGKAVAVTFVYTRCPIPDFCPLMDRHFAAVQAALREDPALAARVHLVSVSFDPEYDTPKVLGVHAARVGADPALWSYVTGAREDIERFGSRFGVSVIRNRAPDDIMHNLRTAVIDPSGRLVRVLGGNDWKAEDLLQELRSASGAR